MNPRLQQGLLRIYRSVLRTGILDTALGRSVFEFFYNLYTAAFDAGSINQLEQFVTPGSTVIDVGANVGFFSRRFARWVREGGRVLAIEPAPDNYRALERAMARGNTATRVEVIQAVATESPGTRYLELNPYHPGDHKIGDEGLEVAAVTVDGLMAERNCPPVSLIKLDVQGAEYQVLSGSRETIQRFHPVLFMEVDDEALRRLGSSAEEVLTLTTDQGYSIHMLEKRGVSEPLTLEEALGMVEKGDTYSDFLMLPSAQAEQ